MTAASAAVSKLRRSTYAGHPQPSLMSLRARAYKDNGPSDSLMRASLIDRIKMYQIFEQISISEPL